LLKRRGVSAGNPNDFLFRIPAGDYLDGILRQFEQFCEQPLQLAVRCAFDGWRRQSDSQSSIVLAPNFGPGRARRNPHREGKGAALPGIANHRRVNGKS